MSGPKQSNFDLAARYRAKLERERQERIAAEMRYATALKSAAAMSSSMEQMGGDVIASALEKNIAHTLIEDINSIKEECLARISAGIPVQGKATDEITRQAAGIEHLVSELNQRVKPVLEEKLSILSGLSEEFGISEKLSDFSQKIGNAAINDGQIRHDFSVAVQNGKDCEISAKIAQLMDEIGSFLEKQNMKEYARNARRLQGDLESLQESTSYDSKEAGYTKLRDAFYALLFGIEGQRKMIDNAYMEYTSLCRILSLPPRGIEAFIDLSEILAENECLRNSYSVSHECEYISSCVTEVMVASGYDVLLSDYVSKGQSTLYQFGDESAVEVYVSQSGCVMMQVVAVGSDTRMSSSEEDKLLSEMFNFCEKYPHIKSELEKRGVIFKNENLMPPDIQFTKKVNIGKKARREMKNEIHKRMH